MLLEVCMTTANRQGPVRYIDRTRDQYAGLGYEPYGWAHIEEAPPFAPVTKPLSESKIGVVATGGIYAEGHTAFNYRDDITYRAIRSDAEAADLRATHFAYDLTDARKDINCVFPIDTLKQLEADGVIGSRADNFYTCMGGIYSQRRVRETLAPEFVERCIADEVDLVLLVPV